MEFAERINAFLEPAKTLEELQRAVKDKRPGTEVHHIVERKSAYIDGFGSEQVEAPDNKVRISKLKHEDITAWFMTKSDKYGGRSPREFLRGGAWYERRRIGLQALIDHGVLKP